LNGRRRYGHTPIEARVTHLFRKVGEFVEVLANLLYIVEPLALDVLSAEDNEPILDILTIIIWCAITRREISAIYTYR
jgi:hypothetical protein